ncbi:uncharacterized protein BYT42DRAFT_647458 [Radiomyces spectabilis]|uniref:uncharacterized protein n=1 Tax=Radiomyces spectabilis TaxID=64574 RepID=UPI00221E77D4|nr:uncharacterized protein BYT42DRAFT_647458 [Radiomyces spectabilis]KAI8371664.1 hypothetical protein BYT42DRAFT_647458 [Radiomyces spectabilis]
MSITHPKFAHIAAPKHSNRSEAAKQTLRCSRFFNAVHVTRFGIETSMLAETYCSSLLLASLETKDQLYSSEAMTMKNSKNNLPLVPNIVSCLLMPSRCPFILFFIFLTNT